MQLVSALAALLLLSSLAQAATPTAQHVHVTTSKDTDIIVQLDPDDADGDPMTTTITELPAVGTLYQLSSNYINFGYTPIRGAEISSTGTAVTGAASHRVVYAAPTAFAPTRFKYTADDGVTSAEGIVEITGTDDVALSSHFHFDADSWQIQTASLSAASWSGTSTGDLNHFIYRGDISLVVNSGANDDRWYFVAPASPFHRNNARLYGGFLRFWLGSFEGSFGASESHDNPKSFVVLECSSCAGGSGRSLAQREVSYSGGLVQFEFTLDENPSSGWLVDPQDTTVTAWSSPTQCEFIEVLAGLDGIRIYGDFTTQHEVVGIDAFELGAGDTTIPLGCY